MPHVSVHNINSHCNSFNVKFIHHTQLHFWHVIRCILLPFSRVRFSNSSSEVASELSNLIKQKLAPGSMTFHNLLFLIILISLRYIQLVNSGYKSRVRFSCRTSICAKPVWECHAFDVHNDPVFEGSPTEYSTIAIRRNIIRGNNNGKFSQFVFVER